MTLYCAFTELLRIPFASLNELFEMLHNRARVDLMKSLLRRKGIEREEVEAFEHAFHCFDICSENRNFLLHATLVEIEDEGNFIFSKATGNSRGYSVAFRLDIADIAIATAAMRITDDYLTRVWLEFSERRRRRVGGARAPEPLPRKPDPPSKLNLHRLG